MFALVVWFCEFVLVGVGWNFFLVGVSPYVWLGRFSRLDLVGYVWFLGLVWKVWINLVGLVR